MKSFHITSYELAHTDYLTTAITNKMISKGNMVRMPAKSPTTSLKDLASTFLSRIFSLEKLISVPNKSVKI